MNPQGAQRGFTLIELSIVLVVIGLVVGGMLVGQNLIAAAQARATITQLQKYNTAANTFRGKYGYLPGDIKDPDASSFGFKPRGPFEGEGDGNGALEGLFSNAAASNRMCFETGELAMFWVDLSTAKMIDGGFNYATSTTTNTGSTLTASTTPSIDTFMPQAKLGQGNYIYVYDYIYSIMGPSTWVPQGINYFGLSGVTNLFADGSITPYMALTVHQAYAIDSKIDDGLPQSGSVTAQYVSVNNVLWAAGGGNVGANNGATPPGPSTAATPGSSTTCYDNGNTAGAVQQYSVEISNGGNVNCALSFRFQ